MTPTDNIDINIKSPRLTSRVKEMLEELFASRADESAPPPGSLDPQGQRVLDKLVAPLKGDPPESSLAAEAALTVAAFSVTQSKVLNVASSVAGDLNTNDRLDGDRTVGDFLCSSILTPKRIPATKGPFQSSTFRSGYLASQARTSSFREYVEWQSEKSRSLREVTVITNSLVDAFWGSASKLPELPELDASKFTFVKYRQLRDRILETGSGGAIEQYFLAGLLEQETQEYRPGARVETKNVGANDRSAKTAGDIQVRHGQGLVSAIEVSAADWRTKTNQLDAAAEAGLREVTIVAVGVHPSASGDELEEKLLPVSTRVGIDPSVVDLHSYMDVLASRITPHGRAEAVRFLYRHLVRYHGRQPALAHRLIEALTALHLNADIETAKKQRVLSSTQRIEQTMRLLYEDLSSLSPGRSMAERLREFADSIESEEGPPNT